MSDPEKISVNGEMFVPVPDGFHVMDDDEKNALSKGQVGPAWAMTDPERHIIVSISWKDVSKLAAVLLNARDLAKNMRKKYGAAAESAGYVFGDIRGFNIGGEKASGYPFTYAVDGITMCGDSAVIKKGETFYFFHTYYCEAMKEEDEPVLEEIYESISFGGMS